MGLNRRYEAQIDARQEQSIHERRGATPYTLPLDAYGPHEIEWAKPPFQPVWAWIYWVGGETPATRIPAFAKGWNDRVVVVAWSAPGGERDTIVWRNAVTKRSTSR